MSRIGTELGQNLIIILKDENLKARAITKGQDGMAEMKLFSLQLLDSTNTLSLTLCTQAHSRSNILLREGFWFLNQTDLSTFCLYTEFRDASKSLSV